MTDDNILLGRFIEERSENALSELVGRHLNLVYFAALRQADGATSIAEDAAQATFLLLTKKADALFGHPNFAGWLHTTACNQARDLVRATQRRHKREQAAQATQTITAGGTNDDMWAQVRPIIDDALRDLAPVDREAVLLRFFEDRPFAAIGRSLELGENAARMRVSRALEHLEIALAKRGVKSTAAALASILEIPAGMTAPVHLAPQIYASILTLPVLTATASTSTVFFKIMTSTKLLLAAASITAVCALTSTLYLRNQLQLSKLEVSALHQRQTDLQAQVKSLQLGLVAEKKRATEADTDNDKLLALTANMLADQSKQTKPQGVITHDMVQTRFQNAKALAKAGRNEEALKEFLWCLDIGMRQVPSFAGVRSSFLLSELEKLGKTHPPALTALQERRDDAERRFSASKSDTDAIMDYASLNRTLGENGKTLALFNSLSADDERRRYLAYNISDQLIEAQRYTELAQASDYSSYAMVFDSSTNARTLAKLSDRNLSEFKRNVSNVTVKNIEALAGAGDLAHASELIAKLLAFDNTDDTRAMLQTHLTRSGHPELLK